MIRRAALLVAALACAAAGPITGDAAVALVAAAMERAGAGRPAMPAPLRALPPCDHVPRVTPFQGRWSAAELSCDSPFAWRRVLRTGTPSAPGRAQAGAPRPGETMTVLVALRPLRRGETVAAADLGQGTARRVDPAQAVVSAAQAEGRRLRVAVGAGQPLLERHLDPVRLVLAGQRVAVSLQAAGLAVAGEGIAQADGGFGDVIRVQMLPQGRVIEAEIAGPRNLIVRPKIR